VRPPKPKLRPSSPPYTVHARAAKFAPTLPTSSQQVSTSPPILSNAQYQSYTPVLPRKRASTAPGYRASCRAKVQNDDLGKLIQAHVDLISNCGWRRLVRRLRGRGDLRGDSSLLQGHPATELLLRMKECGVPAVMTTEPWSDELLDERVARGSHKSCDDHLGFLREELLDFVQKGFFTVLPYRLLKDLRRHKKGFRHLRVSPMGVVPQRDRRPRIIIDLSFYGINQETLKLAPEEAMQFGRALERILYLVHHANPRFGPVHLGKVDLADGFYRILLNDSAISQLAVALPPFPGEEQMIALPLVLPMGWISSSPYFSAATETVADLVNHSPLYPLPPPHPLEALANTKPADALPPPATPLPDDCSPPATTLPDAPPAPPAPPPSAATPSAPELSPTPVLRPYLKPIRHCDVYSDDFLLAIQGHPQARLAHLRRLLHAIDAVFRPLDDQDNPTRKHVPSVKKLLKGDAYLCTRKVILGWIVDTLRGTLELPPHRIQRLHDIFASLRHKTRVTPATWHKVLGELRSMSLGIPGSRGLFSLLQEGFRHSDRHRIRITRAMRDQLDDFEHLAHDLSSRPTALAELVPDHPVAVGPHDASGDGMGGVWLPAISHTPLTPILWRAQFPRHISEALVSFTNPHGSITNSDLELAGLIAQQDIIVQEVNCQGRTLAPLGDNTPTTSWHHKQSTTTTGPAAYLLRLNSIHQRHFQYLSKADYLPGRANQMADDCSRLWHLSDSQLLAHFDALYPQTQPWRLVHLRNEMHSALISALLCKRPMLPSLLNEPPKRTVTGKCGKPSSPSSPLLTPTYGTSPLAPSFLFSKFSAPAYDRASLQPADNLSKLTVWRTTYGPSPRRSSGWGPTAATRAAQRRVTSTMTW